MTYQYAQNIEIAGLTLAVNPDQYEQRFKKYGEFRRTVGGGIVDVDVNGSKLIIELKGLTQTQVEDIKKRCALKKEVSFVDFVPIAEKDRQSRTVYESLSSETIDSETIYLYIPTYTIVIFDFIPTYADNILSYAIVGEEV